MESKRTLRFEEALQSFPLCWSDSRYERVAGRQAGRILYGEREKKELLAGREFAGPRDEKESSGRPQHGAAQSSPSLFYAASKHSNASQQSFK